MLLKQKAAPQPRSRLLEFEVQLVCWRSGRRCWDWLFLRQDADVAPVLALVLEKHDAINQGEQGIVLATRDVHAGFMLGASLADQNCSRMNQLAAEPLHAQPLPL